MVEEILTEAGLTNWESRVFKALVELGETTTGPLVERSEVPQSKIYAILDMLKKKGLASYIIKGKMKYFQAGNPEKIYILLKEKESKIKEEIERLKNLSKNKEGKSYVQIFEGLRAIRLTNAEIIKESKEGEEFYGYSQGIYPVEVNDLYHQFGELRRIEGIKDHLLISKKNKKEFEKSILKEDLSYVKKKTRYSDISFPQDTAIFKENVIIYSWEETPKAILIKNKEVAKNYKRFFLEFWESSK